jgi:hypothetical protein
MDGDSPAAPAGRDPSGRPIGVHPAGRPREGHWVLTAARLREAAL